MRGATWSKELEATPTTANNALSLGDLTTVEDLAAAYPAVLTVPALRWQLRHRDENGLAPACVKMGKKLLIHRPSYERWLAGRTGA